MFKFVENCKKSYLNLKEAVDQLEKIQTIISIQENLKAKAISNFAKDYIETNISILKNAEKEIIEELEKDRDYVLMKRSDFQLEKFDRYSYIKYIENNDDENSDD